MAVVDNGRPAVTHYRVQERFQQHTHVRVRLETGRTHQIRVHMAHIRKPIVGDFVSGGPMRGSGLPVVLPEGLNDRKRVGWGKGVSVSEEFGGGRNLKKQKKP